MNTPTPEPPTGRPRALIYPRPPAGLGVDGDRIARLTGRHSEGQLWERVEESGEGLEVYEGWLVWFDSDAYDRQTEAIAGYGSPPGSYLEPVRNLENIRRSS